MRGKPACAASVCSAKRKPAVEFSAAALRAVLEVLAPADATGLVVALSGGGDSAALLAAAASLGASFRGLPVRALHVDHGLQDAAADFRAACVALCRRLDIPLSVVAVAVETTGGVSIEAAARDARYAALAQQLRPGECLLTAHHRADQAETWLLQALRGAGLKGMSSMPVRRRLGPGWHLRPLLDIAQPELIALGAALGTFPASDPMNADMRFDRGYLRRHIWPLIEARWPAAEVALARAARHAAEAQTLLERRAAADVGRLRDGEALSVPGLRALAAEDRINAVRFWLSDAGVEPPSSARLREALRQIFDADADHLPAILWGGHALRRYRQRVFLTQAELPRMQGPRPWIVAREALIELGPGLGQLRRVPQIGGLAPQRLPETLWVRARVGGESLRPARAARTQSLQHLCQSQGVLPWMRDALPLVFADDVLVAAADLWLEARRCAAPDAPGVAFVWDQAPIIV